MIFETIFKYHAIFFSLLNSGWHGSDDKNYFGLGFRIVGFGQARSLITKIISGSDSKSSGSGGPGFQKMRTNSSLLYTGVTFEMNVNVSSKVSLRWFPVASF